MSKWILMPDSFKGTMSSLEICQLILQLLVFLLQGLVFLQLVFQRFHCGVGSLLQVVQSLLVGTLLHQKGHQQQQEGHCKKDDQIKQHRIMLMRWTLMLGRVL